VLLGAKQKVQRKGASFSMEQADWKQRRRPAQNIGLVFRNVLPYFYRSDIECEEVAIKQRVLLHTPPARRGYWESQEAFVGKLLSSRVQIECSYEDFVAWNSRFPLPRQKLQEKAYHSLSDRCLDRNDFYRRTFLKEETLPPPITDGYVRNSHKDARAIQGASDRANAALGPWMFKFSKYLYRCWAKSSVIYASSMSPEMLGNWYDMAVDKLGDCYALESDLSRMDSSVCSQALDFERRVYQRCGISGHALDALMGQAKTVGFTRHGGFYRVKGTRKSGDPNTSCGNSLLTGSIMRRIMNDCGVPKKAYRCAVLGDDVIALVNRRYNVTSQDIIDGFLAAGMVAEPVFHDDPRDCSFCSGHFWPTQDGTVWGPKVGRTLCKLCWNANIIDDPNDTMRGIVLGLENVFSFIPPLDAFGATLIKLLGRKGTSTYLWRKNAERRHEPNHETWYYLARWYPSYDHGAFLSLLSQVRRLPAACYWSPIVDMVENDQ
jgi:hypothetical protein